MPANTKLELKNGTRSHEFTAKLEQLRVRGTSETCGHRFKPDAQERVPPGEDYTVNPRARPRQSLNLWYQKAWKITPYLIMATLCKPTSTAALVREPCSQIDTESGRNFTPGGLGPGS